MTVDHTPRPTLLLVGGARAVTISVAMVVEALKQARARGIRTHVVAPAAALAATPEVIAAADAVSAVDFIDPQAMSEWATAEAAEGRTIDAVYALQEMAQVTVAETARVVGASGNPPEAVHRVRTKDLCRAALSESGFTQPRVRLCDSAADAEAFMEEVPGPWVVKPRDAMGSIGVSLVETPEHLARALDALPDPNRFLIEEFVVGPEFSVEGVFLEGQPHIFAITAKDKAAPPFFVEIGHTLPAVLSPAEKARIEASVTAALRVLGLRAGAFHVELWLTPDDVVLGEVHGRYGGDWIHRMLEHAVPGLDLYGVVYDDLLGRRDGRSGQLPERGAAVRYFTPPPGRLLSVEGWDEVRRHPSVLYSEISVKPGDRIHPLRRSSDRAGLIVVGAEDAPAAEKLARELAESLVFTVEPDRSTDPSS
ncbi:ATP-grasp domain-containing protein [Streptomyces sp. NPDC050997]|uniref:ATP-grasp domain-containing protein n=1 Tax=Streptomyces sp. NPDC050997 TaxID=3155519 RepID=UPI00342E3432